MLWEYSKSYGRVFKMGFGRRPTVVVTDPEIIKQITIKEFHKFQNRWFPEVNPPINSFLFIARDEQWKKIRTTLSPTFSAMKLKEVIPLMDEAAEILAGKLKLAAAKTGEYTSSLKLCFYVTKDYSTFLFVEFCTNRIAVMNMIWVSYEIVRHS